jgi:CPA1 family monovalent cation:H+ antiporter
MRITLLESISILVILAATFGYLNNKLFRLPMAIGLLLWALAASVSLLFVDAIVPSWGLGDSVRSAVLEIDFSEALMRGMLGFLLFAGALHVGIDGLLEARRSVLLLATLGTMISTFIVGSISYYVFQVCGEPVPLIWCFVFGALIAPTDPIAVLGIMKSVGAPHDLEIRVAGESLFNDGIGVILFTVLLGVAAAGHGDHGEMTAPAMLEIFAVEVIGGIVLGLASGYFAYRIMRTLDEHNLEVLITIALVMGILLIAFRVHTSAPLACVVAGIFIGNHGREFAMSRATRQALDLVWEFFDEALNAILFLLVGLEVFAVSITGAHVLAGVMMIPVGLLARLAAVSLPIAMVGHSREQPSGVIRVLTWGGLKGGISVALALSLPEFEGRSIVLAATYAIVVFSIVVQGLTMKPLLKSLAKAS